MALQSPYSSKLPPMYNYQLAADLLEAYVKICDKQHKAPNDTVADRWCKAAVAIRWYIAERLVSN